jgi:hypothetical protein
MIAAVAAASAALLLAGWFVHRHSTDVWDTHARQLQRLGSEAQRLIWEFRNCYGCVPSPADMQTSPVRAMR